MLPGYNHNIRYKDKLFHVQTEDNGLDDPDLVTQIFLGGQIVAIERSSYGDVLVDSFEEKARDERIKSLMQEQHKRLLKNLIRGEYDPKIENFLRAAAALAPDQELLLEAPPDHQPDFDALDAAILAAEQNPITPESLLAPDAVLEMSTNELFAQQPRQISVADTDPIPRASILKTPTPSPTPHAFRVEDLKNALRRPDGRADSDRFDNNDDAMLGMIEQHMHQQLPWAPGAETKPSDPSTAATLEEPNAESTVAHIQRARELARQAETSRDTKRIPIPDKEIGIDEMPTKLGRRKPSNPNAGQAPSPTEAAKKIPDTLIDYGLPAALRREIDDEIARRQSEPTPSPTPHTPTPRTASGTAAPKDGRVALYRTAAQKPEGRYSNVRKLPPDRPFDAATTPVDPNLDKNPKRKATDRFPSTSQQEPTPDTLIDVDRAKIDAADAARVRTAGSRRVTRPPAPDPKTSTPPAPSPRKIVEKQGPQPNPSDKPAQAEDPKRPSILVVERSLDEVILSYLYDEMAEK